MNIKLISRKYWRKISHKQELSIATGLVLFFIAFETVLFHENSLLYIVEAYQAGGLTWPVIIDLILYGLTFVVSVLWLWFTFLAQPFFRLLYQILFITPLAIQYSYWQAGGGFMEVYDFNIISNLSGEAIPLTPAAVVAQANLLMLIPMGLLMLLLLKFQPPVHPRRDALGFGVLILALSLLMGGSFFYQYWRYQLWQPPKADSLKVLAWDGFIKGATFSFLEQATLYDIMTNYNREQLSFQAPTTPANNLVLIIDESVRGDHLSLNGYRRKTTPYLEQLAAQGLIYNWGVAAAGATCSNQSVAALLTGVYALPDVAYQTPFRPTLFQYAKAMGYTVTVFDAEAEGPRFHFSQEDFQFVDYFMGIQHFGHEDNNDLKVARAAAQLLGASTGNFLVILKNGVHFPYNARYPEEATVWFPTLKGEYTLLGEREELLNSYDNALRYNVDSFFKTLLHDPHLLETTTFVYTSDHGQTLGEEGARHAHCKNSQGEAQVPLLLISQQVYNLDEQYPASHQNIFASLLDLMNFPQAGRLYPYAPSLFEANSLASGPRYFLYGSLHGSGAYEIVEFEDANLQTQKPQLTEKPDF